MTHIQKFLDYGDDRERPDLVGTSPRGRVRDEVERRRSMFACETGAGFDGSEAPVGDAEAATAGPPSVVGS